MRHYGRCAVTKDRQCSECMTNSNQELSWPAFKYRPQMEIHLAQLGADVILAVARCRPPDMCQPAGLQGVRISRCARQRSETRGSAFQGPSLSYRDVSPPLPTRDCYLLAADPPKRRWCCKNSCAQKPKDFYPEELDASMGWRKLPQLRRLGVGTRTGLPPRLEA